MNQETLYDVLVSLSNELPKADELDDIDGLEEVMSCLEGVIGWEAHLADYDDGSSAQLPANLKKLFDALKYVHCIWELLETIAFDGLYSVFYNGSWEQIARLRNELKASDETLSALFEEALLLAAPLDLQQPDNFVTRNPGVSPMTALSDEALDQMIQLDDRIEEIRDEIFDRALIMYQGTIE